MTDNWRSVADDPPCAVGEYVYVLACIAGAKAPVVYVADRTYTDEIRWFYWAGASWQEWNSSTEGDPTLWLPCPVPPQEEANG